jgi:hypothetical protein
MSGPRVPSHARSVGVASARTVSRAKAHVAVTGSQRT